MNRKEKQRMRKNNVIGRSDTCVSMALGLNFRIVFSSFLLIACVWLPSDDN